MVVGALGTIPKALEKHLKQIGTSVRVELLQKAALLRDSKDSAATGRSLDLRCNRQKRKQDLSFHAVLARNNNNKDLVAFCCKNLLDFSDFGRLFTMYVTQCIYTYSVS